MPKKTLPKSQQNGGHQTTEVLNRGGRPTKFKPEYADLIVAFFDVAPYEKQILEETTEYFANGSEKKSSSKYRYTPTKFPTLLGFARSIEVDYGTIKRWAEKGEQLEEDMLAMSDAGEKEKGEFDDAFQRFCKSYNVAKELQKEWLIANGMAGAAPPASFIFVAKNVTDMRDKIERTDTLNHNVFFVPREIAEKHGLELPERDREEAPLHLEAPDVKVVAPVP